MHICVCVHAPVLHGLFLCQVQKGIVHGTLLCNVGRLLQSSAAQKECSYFNENSYIQDNLEFSFFVLFVQ